MNQSKQKMMKGKLKYYAQFIGINLLAALIPILAVILIYGIGKLKNACTNPYVISQEIYDCCLWATIVVLTGFSVGFWLLSWADKWRKAKLSSLKIKREHEELGLRIEMKVDPIEERAGQKNMPASDNSEFENLSGLTAKQIWWLYSGRKAYVHDADYENDYCPIATIAGYSIDSVIIVGFSEDTHASYDEIVDDVNREIHPDWYIEKGYNSYLEFDLDDVHIIKQ